MQGAQTLLKVHVDSFLARYQCLLSTIDCDRQGGVVTGGIGDIIDPAVSCKLLFCGCFGELS
jgi:hypothetical protein